MPECGGSEIYMRSLKLLHAADLHLDSPFEGMGAAKAAQRRQEQRQLLFRIAQLAQSEHVDLVLLAGDLLDSDSSYAETAEALSEALGSIPAPVFISPGNHDFYSPRSAYARVSFPENVHIFKKPEPECVELAQLGVRVWGAAFCDKYSGGMLHGFSTEKSAGVKDVMCIHGEVAAASNYDPIAEADIAASGMDYVALGHIHKASGLKRAGASYYAWPGCPEGRGFDETGEKYVYIVTIGRDCTVKPVCLAQRKYEILSVELKDGDVISTVLDALPKDTGSDVYRIVLRGETSEPPQTEAVRAALEDKFFSLQIRDETVLKRDMWQSAGEDNLRGQFLRRLRAAFDAAGTDAERERISQAARWGLAALDKREEVVRHDDKKA